MGEGGAQDRLAECRLRCDWGRASVVGGSGPDKSETGRIVGSVRDLRMGEKSSRMKRARLAFKGDSGDLRQSLGRFHGSVGYEAHFPILYTVDISTHACIFAGGELKKEISASPSSVFVGEEDYRKQASKSKKGWLGAEFPKETVGCLVQPEESCGTGD
ncbi:hypothetical protein MA16_Dca016802 [Dendrobium catenatum]|uniref:Uncharacterized protein n=1 Tax=Dendrobium catenatum TaxID=906689 RepID=A0A2I0VYF0_9ASPA|nr:hypothetical protein MA16_Dca016802 [Dendrobium catenatum]